MHLSILLKNTSITLPTSYTEQEVNGLCVDSRMADTGFIYFASKGTQVDGMQFAPQAIVAGASVIIGTELPVEQEQGILYLQSKNVAADMGQIAATFYGQPSQKMKIVGVTGTNGKTTVATLLFQLFTDLGYDCGLISTVENKICDRRLASTHTTPHSIAIQKLMAEMVKAGCTYCFMEVSSHAIHQERIAGIEFAGGIFTNITHDHLDYHKTFDEYIRVKKLFFDALPKSAFALSNVDDKRGMVMLQNTKALRQGFGLKNPADFKAKILENRLDGLLLNIANKEVHFLQAGIFNAYNLLAVYGAAVLLGEQKDEVLEILSKTLGAAGRFTTLRSPKEGIVAIVDYAHTPDALLNVLATINQFEGGGKTITVIGCGGDRDSAKRPLMATVACEHSQQVILTADNPRTENPERILDDMEQGINAAQQRKVLRIADRRQAIKTAISMAKGKDIVLIAGKGHEAYQEINGVRHHFDDTEEVLNLFKTLDK